MKNINTPYYNNRNIEAWISKNIITITAKIIKIIKLSWEKNINKKESKKKNVIIIALIMGKKFNKKRQITITKSKQKMKKIKL